MNKYQQLYDIADDMFDSGDIYFWTMLGAVVWACRPVAKGPMLNQ